MPEQLLLSECIDELLQAEEYLATCQRGDVEVKTPVLLLLLKAAIYKLDYYAEKYDFKIDDSDSFETEDLMDFVRNQAGPSSE